MSPACEAGSPILELLQSSAMHSAILNTAKFIIRDASSLSVPGQNIKDIRIDPRNNYEYIAKKPSHAGRYEAMTECVLNCIGERLGVHMAEHRLGICDGELWFMSRNFLRPDEALVHGYEFLGQFFHEGYFEKLKKRSPEERSFYSIRNVFDAFDAVYMTMGEKFIYPFSKMLFLDAIVGCQDRHPKNWGIIHSVKGKQRDRFAPVFDTARALFWNFSTTDDLRAMTPTKLRSYVRLSRPPLGDFQNRRINHFDLIRQVLTKRPQLGEALSTMISSKKEEHIRELIEDGFGKHLPQVRRYKILECLGMRFAHLRAILRDLGQ